MEVCEARGNNHTSALMLRQKKRVQKIKSYNVNRARATVGRTYQLLLDISLCLSQTLPPLV